MKNPKKVLLIVNPAAGKMKSKVGMFEIVDEFCKNNFHVCVQTTLARGHATEVVRERGEQYDMIVCCGGDGTLNEVVSGVMELNAKPEIGYIPAGSTNDFANTMDLSANIEKAAKSIVLGEPKPLDVGMFQGKDYFTYIASFGAFTAASYSASQTSKNLLGHLAYIFEGIKDLGKIQPYHMSVTTNEQTLEGEYIFGAVTNSTSVGGIVKLGSHLVDMGDGLFEVILIKQPKNASELSKIVTAVTSSNFDCDMIEFLKTSKIEFEMEKGISWSLDGEHKKGRKHVSIENIRHGISIIL